MPQNPARIIKARIKIEKDKYFSYILIWRFLFAHENFTEKCRMV